MSKGPQGDDAGQDASPESGDEVQQTEASASKDAGQVAVKEAAPESTDVAAKDNDEDRPGWVARARVRVKQSLAWIGRRVVATQAWGWLTRDSLSRAAALTILALVCAAFLMLWATGLPEMTDGKWWHLHADTLEWKDRLTIAGAVAAGAGAAFALVISYRKQRDVEAAKFDAAFAEATAQLGDPTPVVRIAGAYALATLADHHEDRRRQCIEALCAYLRLSYTPDKLGLTSTTITRSGEDDQSGRVDTFTYRADDREVRLTIIRLIRDHLRDPQSPTTWCGHDLDLTGAVFDGGDFSGTHFTEGSTVSFTDAKFSGGRVSFQGAKFSGGRVSFEDAMFSGGRVSFEDAMFSGGEVSFERATVVGGRVNFRRARFGGSDVSFDSTRLNDGRVSFDWVELSGGTVTFAGAQFSGCDVSFYKAKFASKVYFFEARFSQGTVSFLSAEVGDGEILFTDALFTGGQVFFSNTSFTGGSVYLGGAEFRGSEVRFLRARFAGAEVSFKGSRILGGSLVFGNSSFESGKVSFDGAKFVGGEVTRDGEPFRGWPTPVHS